VSSCNLFSCRMLVWYCSSLTAVDITPRDFLLAVLAWSPRHGLLNIHCYNHCLKNILWLSCARFTSLPEIRIDRALRALRSHASHNIVMECPPLTTTLYTQRCVCLHYAARFCSSLQRPRTDGTVDQADSGFQGIAVGSYERIQTLVVGQDRTPG
jgi:hypothetical protein